MLGRAEQRVENSQVIYRTYKLRVVCRIFLDILNKRESGGQQFYFSDTT
jgi:hypothetical protein